VLSTQTYLFQSVTRTRGPTLWTLQPATRQRSAFALSDSSNTRTRRRRTQNPKLDPRSAAPENRKRARPCEPAVIKRESKTLIKFEDGEEEDIDIDGDFVDLFSGVEMKDVLQASFNDESSNFESASLSDIDVLYFGDDDGIISEDEDYRERPLKKARIDLTQASAGSQRALSRRSRIIHEMTLEDLEEVENKRKTNKAKRRLKKDSSDPESRDSTDPEGPAARVPISMRRFVSITEQYDYIEVSEVMNSDLDGLSEEVHSSDDEFNDDPILIEIVPEWQWPGVEHHPFFLHDKRSSGSKDEMSALSSSGHVSETHDKSDSKSDDEIDILGGSSDSSDDEELPLKQPLISDSEEEPRVFSPDEQPALSDVANQNLFIPTWRIVDIDGDVIELVSIEPSSNDDELPESAYKKMHRRRELIEKMELREFLKARKKRTNGKKF